MAAIEVDKWETQAKILARANLPKFKSEKICWNFLRLREKLIHVFVVL